MNLHKPKNRKVEDLKPHPRNYRGHPQDQIDHIASSIKQHGFYRNVVCAEDGTILAGHGVVLAAKQLGMPEVPVIMLPIPADDPKAMKILTGDNELMRLAEVDDRLLSEILKEVRDVDVDGLIGTGYDEKMLANLVMITRPQSEINDIDEAAQWVGMPSFEPNINPKKIVVNFENAEDRVRFMDLIGAKVLNKSHDEGNIWSIWWPEKEIEDKAAYRFVESNADA